MKVDVYPEIRLPRHVGLAITFGNFDGVHGGHQRIMKELVERSERLGVPAVAVTFEPHPISVLSPQFAPRRITTPEQKQEILGSLGIDLLIVIRFTVEFSKMEPETFIREVVVERLRARELVLGGNFRFGRGRSGDLSLLAEAGRKHDFTVREVPPSLYRGEMISSSRIRSCLAEGKVEDAAEMLGRAYFVDGRVIPGDRRGEKLGFPTANLDVHGDLLVGDGVYVSSARVGQEIHPGMTHVGRRPTFGIETRAVETHLFDFARQIYGEPLRLHLHRRLRGTIAFRGPEELRRQLEADRSDARAFFRERRRNLAR